MYNVDFDLHSLNLTFVIPVYIYNLAINIRGQRNRSGVGSIYFAETFELRYMGAAFEAPCEVRIRTLYLK